MTPTKKWKKLARAANNQEHENSSGDIPNGRPVWILPMFRDGDL